jgi:hypothetical protein
MIHHTQIIPQPQHRPLSFPIRHTGSIVETLPWPGFRIIPG